jgi:hypothetical protein
VAEPRPAAGHHPFEVAVDWEIRGRIAQSTRPLADTASRISGLVDSFRQKFGTVAVLQTTTGTFITGSGDVELERAQRDAVTSAGATRIKAAGVDAEVTALKNAEGKPQFIAASRRFCDSCRKEIQDRGGLITSPTTAVFSLNILFLARGAAIVHPVAGCSSLGFRKITLLESLRAGWGTSGA